MKVALRLTTATAVFVVVAASAFAVVDLRARAAERHQAFVREGRAVLLSLRAGLERLPAQQWEAPLASLAEALTLGAAGWRVALVGRARASVFTDPDRQHARQNQWLRAMIAAPQLLFSEPVDDQLVQAVAVLADAPLPDVPATELDGGASSRRVVALVEVAKRMDSVHAANARDRQRALALVAAITLTATLAIWLLARSVVSRPIAKLLRGIEDVAHGDLSHVILSERDDEVGQIATRFNEMTHSLRESRAETERQHSAKRGLEQRLGHTEKLATIGQLAAEIAHEVGTPLGVIAGRARTTAKKAHDPEAVIKNAGIIGEQTARITKIIQRLLDFTRRKVGAPETSAVDLRGLTVVTCELLSAQFAAQRVKSVVQCEAPVPIVMGDADRLQQVLINLLLNSVQAMPHGGALTTMLQVAHRSRPGLENAGAATFVQITVRDTGPGVPLALREQIFDPFFTTKDGAGGTGLGLAVCIGIVKEHDGWIEVDDAPGGGADFRVFIPASEPAPTRTRESSGATLLPHPTRRDVSGVAELPSQSRREV